MSGSPLHPLQEALYTRLTSAVSPVVVYDDVPDGAAFPYVTLGESTETDISPKGAGFYEATHTLHVWSRYKGFKQCNEIIDSIAAAFETPLDMAADGYTDCYTRVEYRQVMRDPDGITRHGVVRIRVRIQEN